ncbi:MAG: aromatic amino acid lyase [Solirubrobacteraceae bacterium]
MTVALAQRSDITLDTFRRVAWNEEAVAIEPDAAELIDRRRDEFEAFVADHPERRFYGVNVHAGDGSNQALNADEQRDYARGMQSGVSFGEPLPRRVVRGIVLARLSNLIEGHSAATSGLVQAVAQRLDGRSLPAVPRYGNGGSGEIAALGWLFGDMGAERPLQRKESMSLINGCPCAAALVADATLCSELLVACAERVFGLAAGAFGVSPAIYDRRLDALWGDPHQAAALRAIRANLEGAPAPDDEHPQPPVSFRILPRVLGNALRVLDDTRRVAEVALPAVSDNPVFLFDGDPVDVVSTGGFHSGTAAPAIDALTFALADLAQLAAHQLQRLQASRHALPRFDSTNLGILQMAAGGYAEEVRGACVPTLLPAGGWGQNDVPSPAFTAWNRHDRVRGFVTGTLACLAAIAGQSFAQTDRPAPTALTDLLAQVLESCPPITARRALGPDLARLAGSLGAGVPD